MFTVLRNRLWRKRQVRPAPMPTNLALQTSALANIHDDLQRLVALAEQADVERRINREWQYLVQTHGLGERVEIHAPGCSHETITANKAGA